MKRLFLGVIAVGMVSVACSGANESEVAATDPPSDPQALIAPLRDAARKYQADTAALHANVALLVGPDSPESLAPAEALVADAKAMDADIDRIEQLMNDAIARHQTMHATNTGSDGPESPGPKAPPQSLPSTLAQMQQMQAIDQQQAQTIMTQIQADAQKQQLERWKIMQDTQMKIFDILQDVTINKSKTTNPLYKLWDDYIRK